MHDTSSPYPGRARMAPYGPGTQEYDLGFVRSQGSLWSYFASVSPPRAYHRCRSLRSTTHVTGAQRFVAFLMAQSDLMEASSETLWSTESRWLRSPNAWGNSSHLLTRPTFIVPLRALLMRKHTLRALGRGPSL